MPLLIIQESPAQTGRMQDGGWPPGEDADLSLQIILRLQSLCRLTQVRRVYWSGTRAEIAVWPYSEHIAAAVSELLAPIEALVEPQETLPAAGTILPDGREVRVAGASQERNGDAG